MKRRRRRLSNGGARRSIAGESQNNVDLTYQGWSIGADWDVTRKWTLNASYGQYRLNGHYDPYGIHANYAIATNNTSFDTFDLVQSQPVVGWRRRFGRGGDRRR